MILELLAATATSLSPQLSSEPEGCAVAVHHVEKFLARRPGRYVFSPTAQGWPSHLDRSTGNDERPIDPVFSAKINATPPSGAVEACASLRRFLDARGIPSSAEAVAEATWANDPQKQLSFEPFDRTNIILTLPLLNEEGSEAFLQMAVVPHPRHCAMFSYTLDLSEPEFPVTRWRSGPLC